MTPLVLAYPGNESTATALCARGIGEPGQVVVRRFPDGESYVRVESDVRDRTVVVVCALDRPDEKTLPLLLLAAAARDGGARAVLLVAPYLAYLRQDARFRPGEALSSRAFARLLGGAFDGLVTVEPHLHRHRSLGEVYSIPTVAESAASVIARWIGANVSRPAVLGPDAESEAWVRRIGAELDAPWAVLDKTRLGDRDVGVSGSGRLTEWRDHSVVVVDDVASTGRTLIAAIECVEAAGCASPTCVVVHPLFAGSAYEDVRTAGARRVVSTDTIRHVSNEISVVPLLADALTHWDDAAPGSGPLPLDAARPAV